MNNATDDVADETGPYPFGAGIEPNPKARYWQQRADFWMGHALRLGYAPPDDALAQQPAGVDLEQVDRTDRELLVEFIRICREHKPVGQWPGERLCSAIERVMQNEKPFRFIAEADMAPERGHNGRGGDADRPFSGPKRAQAQQPAAVDGAWETAPPDLYNEISSVLNKHSAESGSNTPDYVLAQFLLESMTAFNAATNRRDAHYNGSALAGGAK